MTEKMNILTTADMDRQDPSLIPAEIMEYRTLKKDDLITKVIEAREEISELKKVIINKAKIEEDLKKKDHYAVANELYALRQIIKDIKESMHVLPTEDGESKPVESPKAKRGRPKKA